MAQVIPTRTDVAAYTLRVDLTGVEFLFEFRFNDRESFWYFDLADALAAPIVQGVKVVLGVPLLRNVVDVRRPVGDLFAIDQSNADLEAGESDLGDRVLFVYEDGAT